jgi:LmbE family N-acetylglucosaminyl deacetylase
MVTQQRRIAVIVAHPDDEILGFGGVMCRHAEAGESVSVLFLATGLAARSADGKADASALKRLQDDARKANKVVGVEDVEFSDCPDNRMDSMPLLDVIKRVEAFVDKVDPAVVYTHHPDDLNVDHEVTARAVMTACRPLPGAHARTIYSGEVISSSEYSFPQRRFVPNTYVGIAKYLARKCAALQCYGSEVRAWPHPRSAQAVEALAHLRGSECGLDAAEALCLLRDVKPDVSLRT